MADPYPPAYGHITHGPARVWFAPAPTDDAEPLDATADHDGVTVTFANRDGVDQVPAIDLTEHLR